MKYRKIAIEISKQEKQNRKVAAFVKVLAKTLIVIMDLNIHQILLQRLIGTAQSVKKMTHFTHMENVFLVVEKAFNNSLKDCSPYISRAEQH